MRYKVRSATGAVACFSPPHGSSLLLIVSKSKTKYFSIVSIHSSHKWPIFSKLVEALGGGIWTAVVGDWDRSVIFCLFRLLIWKLTDEGFDSDKYKYRSDIC